MGKSANAENWGGAGVRLARLFIARHAALISAKL